MQPLANHKEDDFLNREKDELIVQRSNVYSSHEVLCGIHKYLIPLYSLVLSQNYSKNDLLATKKSTRILDEDIFISNTPHSLKLQNNY